MDAELAQYIFHNCAHLLTETERAAERHLATTVKATDGQSDVAAQAEVAALPGRSRWLSSDPAVLALAADGLSAFRQRAATRILGERAHEVVLNRCPRCAGLTRTPQARWCPHCGLAWHDTADV
jgi:hypothetical protein